MSIPVLVRSVGPEPSPGYYTQWTTFIAGYPKFKNQYTGEDSALYNGAAIEANLVAYRAHYLYFTGVGSGVSAQIVDRLVDFDLPLPGVGEYHDIPVDAYSPPGGGLGGGADVDAPPGISVTPNPGAGQNVDPPPPPPPGPEPAVIDVTVFESFAVRSGDTKVTPWMLPGRVSERALTSQRWANMAAILNPTPGVVASVQNNGEMVTQLVGQEFGFSVPSGVEVVGVEVELTRRAVGGIQEEKQIAVVATPYGIYYSYDFSQWHQTNISEPSEIVRFANGVFIASSNNSNVLYVSADGQTFTPRTVTGAPGPVYSIEYGNGVWCASCGNRIARSTDNGTTWSAVNYQYSNTQVFSNDDRLIATNGAGNWIVNAGSSIYTSTDNGATWVYRGAPINGTFGSFFLLYDSGYFFAVGTDAAGVEKVYRSANMLTWSLLPNAPVSITPYGLNIVFQKVQGGFVIQDSSAPNPQSSLLLTTDAGGTFTPISTPTFEGEESEFGYILGQLASGKYVIGSYLSNALSAFIQEADLDSTTGSIIGCSSPLISSEDTVTSYLAGYGLFPAIGPVSEAKNGIEREQVALLRGGWYQGDVFTRVIPAGRVADEGAAIPGGTYFQHFTPLFDGVPTGGPTAMAPVSVGGDGFKGYSPTNPDALAETWTAASVNDPSFGVTYSARGTQGRIELASVRARIHYRADFSQDTLPAKRPQGLAGVAESPAGVKVAVGVDGKILRKLANSPTWDAITSGTAVSLNAVEWVGDRFIAVGIGGIALDGGADGSTWTRIETGATTSLWAVRRIPNTLRAVAVGNDDYAFHRDYKGAWST